MLLAAAAGGVALVRDGGGDDPASLFASATSLGDATSVRITVVETTEVDGEAASETRSTTDLHFGERRGRAAAETPSPVEVRFDDSAQWLRVASPGPATQGKPWIRVPVGPTAPARYDFGNRLDPTQGADLLRGATSSSRNGRERIGTVDAVTHDVELDVDRLRAELPAERRDRVATPLSVLDLARLELRASLDDRGRLVRLTYEAPLAKSATPTTVRWSATYVYDGPVDVSAPVETDTLTVDDPAQAAQLVGTTQVG